MPQATGTFKFAPPLNSAGNRVRRDGTTTDWWLIIECDREFGKYLRHLRLICQASAPPLAEPLWGTHVSIIRGEMPPNIQHWGTIDGNTVSIQYSHSPRETSGYFYLPVQCEAALDYRQLLGLPREPEFPLHLTFGNSK